MVSMRCLAQLADAPDAANIAQFGSRVDQRSRTSFQPARSAFGKSTRILNEPVAAGYPRMFLIARMNTREPIAISSSGKS